MKLKNIIFSIMALFFIFIFMLNSCARIASAETTIEETSAKQQGSQETETIKVEETEVTAAAAVEATTDTVPETETTRETEIVPFRFALSGDSNPEEKTSPQREVFKNILEQINSKDPDFYISTGDVIYGHVGNKDVILKQINDFLDVMKILNCDFFITSGDNDTGSDKQKSYFKELIKKDENFYQHFKHKGVNFIILASLGFDEDYKKEQMLWLEEKLIELKKEPVFIFIHKPVYSYLHPKEEKDEQLIGLINEYKVDGVFSGHEHLYNSRTAGKVEYIITGPSGSRPYVSPEEGGITGYLIVDLNEENWTYRFFDENGELFDEDTAAYN
jgi:hypothetical protein